MAKKLYILLATFCLLLVPQAASAASAPSFSSFGTNNVTQTSAEVSVHLDPNSQDTSYYARWGTSTGDYPNSTSSAQLANPGPYSFNIYRQLDNLPGGTQIHVQFVATNGTGTSYSPDYVFTTGGTPLSAPVISSVSVSGASNSTAEVSASIDPRGAETQYEALYWLPGGEVQTTPIRVLAATGTGVSYQVYFDLTGLQSSKTYNLQIWAKNSAGSLTSPTQQFQTTAAPPAISNVHTSVTTLTLARVVASVTGQNLSSVSVQYGATADYGQTSPATYAAGESGYFADLSGLSSGQTLHYRFVASNDAGTVVSADQTVTTLSPPTLTDISVIQQGGDAVVSAHVDPHGQTAIVGVRYGPMSNPATANGSATPQLTVSGGAQRINFRLTGLTTGREYHFQVEADTDSAGATISPDQTFTLTGSFFLVPTVSGFGVAEIGTTSAKLNWQFTGSGSTGCLTAPGSGGQTLATTEAVQFGLGASYELGTVQGGLASGVGTGPKCGEAVASLEHLKPGTTYHWRAISGNPAGSVSSPDQTFTTLYQGALAASTKNGKLLIKGKKFAPRGKVELTIGKTIHRKIRANSKGVFSLKIKLKTVPKKLAIKAEGPGNATVAAKLGAKQKARGGQ